MDNEIKQVLEAVRSGALPVEDALLRLKTAPFADIGYAKVDLHRKVRQGAAEVIYGAGKTPEQIAGILEVMRENGQETVLITRLAPEAAEAVGRTCPIEYFPQARVGIQGPMPPESGIGSIVVATSVGYGASFHGLSALLSMLNSCASGVSVVNIDNGFGAGYLASMINHMDGKRRSTP